MLYRSCLVLCSMSIPSVRTVPPLSTACLLRIILSLPVQVSTKKQKKTAKKEAATEQEERNLVLRGTKITSSTVNVPATYSGIDRVVEYDFTHRDVPEAFEGFRIAFISDLHYKSLLKEKGLNNLVDL